VSVFVVFAIFASFAVKTEKLRSSPFLRSSV